jgi:integrase
MVDLPKYVQRVDDRLYFRRTRVVKGKRTTDRIRLPDSTDDPLFAAAYLKLLNDKAPVSKERGSMAELVSLYKNTQDYRNLAPGTKRMRNIYLARIEDDYGRKPYAGVTKGKLKQIRDSMGDTPGASRNMMAVLSVLYACAVDLDLVQYNPVTGLAKLPIGEYQPWPEKLIAHVLDRASPMLRLAVILHLYTGQRIGDVCNMQWKHVDGDVIEVVQQKTHKTVWVPMHSSLKAELAKVPRHIHWMIYNANGEQMRPERLRDRLYRVLPDDRWHWHGLRKNAVNAMLEAGCTIAQVSAITGQTLEVVAHYAKGRDAKALARAAMDKWESGTPSGTHSRNSK